MQTLEATGTEIGILNAARWLPYLLFGLLAGVVVDRYRRKPLLVSTDLGRAVVLAIIPISAAYDVLTLPLLIAVVLVFGALSLVYDAAHQSFPRRSRRSASETSAARFATGCPGATATARSGRWR